MKREIPFEGILGNTVELRILEHLLSTPKIEFNITELKRVSGVSRTSVDKVVKNFAGWGIVRDVQTRAGITYYGLNEDSGLSHSMSLFNGAILERMYPGLLEATPVRVSEKELQLSEAEKGESEWVWVAEPPSTYSSMSKRIRTPTHA